MISLLLLSLAKAEFLPDLGRLASLQTTAYTLDKKEMPISSTTVTVSDHAARFGPSFLLPHRVEHTGHIKHGDHELEVAVSCKHGTQCNCEVRLMAGSPWPEFDTQKLTCGSWNKDVDEMRRHTFDRKPRQHNLRSNFLRDDHGDCFVKINIGQGLILNPDQPMRRLSDVLQCKAMPPSYPTSVDVPGRDKFNFPFSVTTHTSEVKRRGSLGGQAAWTRTYEIATSPEPEGGWSPFSNASPRTPIHHAKDFHIVNAFGDHINGEEAKQVGQLQVHCFADCFCTLHLPMSNNGALTHCMEVERPDTVKIRGQEWWNKESLSRSFCSVKIQIRSTRDYLSREIHTHCDSLGPSPRSALTSSERTPQLSPITVDQVPVSVGPVDISHVSPLDLHGADSDILSID